MAHSLSSSIGKADIPKTEKQLRAEIQEARNRLQQGGNADDYSATIARIHGQLDALLSRD